MGRPRLRPTSGCREWSAAAWLEWRRTRAAHARGARPVVLVFALAWCVALAVLLLLPGSTPLAVLLVIGALRTRRLADLQTANRMLGGTASLADTYSALIADIGTKTHQAGSNASMQQSLLNQAEASRSEVSGVNLDEEAADLVRFQQAYQAAAQVINVANSLFDSLLSAVRR